MKSLIPLISACLLSLDALASGNALVCVFEKQRMFINAADGSGKSIETDTRMVVSVERGAEAVVRVDGMRMERVTVENSGNTITFLKPPDFLHDAEGWDKPRVPGMIYTLGFAPNAPGSAIMTGVNGAFATVSVGACADRPRE